MATKSKSTYPVYEAQVGALGRVTFYKEPQSNTYCFIYFNGMDYTPLLISEEAAYFTWLFIGREHPDAITSNTLSPTIGNKPRPSKKAGRSKAIKKRPSLAKKAKSK